MKQTAIQLLKESLDYEMKLGTKMVINWDMYLEMEKEQIIKAYNAGEAVEIFELNLNLAGEEYYARRYDTTKGLPEENSKRRGWHY